MKIHIKIYVNDIFVSLDGQQTDNSMASLLNLFSKWLNIYYSVIALCSTRIVPSMIIIESDTQMDF